MLTAAVARKIWRYNRATGNLVWKIRGQGIRLGTVAGVRNKWTGYWRVAYERKTYTRSHVVWLYVTGKWPKEEIDHINRNRSDDRFENLREASRSQNMFNRNLFKNNKLGVRGVTRQDNGYTANIRVNGVRIYLGYFKTIEEAKRAYDEAATRFFGNFATTKGE